MPIISFTALSSFLTAILFVIGSFTIYSQEKNISNGKVNSTANATKQFKTIDIIGVGDIMLGTNFPKNKNYLPADDGKKLLASARDELQSADVTFGNMEAALSDDAPLEKKCQDTTQCYAFRMPLRYADHLKNTGFDVLSLANNHVWDFGIEGIKDAGKKLDELKINFAGPKPYPNDIFRIDNITYGFVAFAPNKGCYQINDYDSARQMVAELDKKVDIVIVSFHGGAEGLEHQHIPNENEIYYGEDRGNVREFAKTVIDHGADVVFGHGPHVVRAVEQYKKRFIAYSLGNFATYGRFNLAKERALAPAIQVTLNEDGVFQKAKVFSFTQKNYNGPKKDKSHNAYFKIKELTQQDFPNRKLLFADAKKEIYPFDMGKILTYWKGLIQY